MSFRPNRYEPLSLGGNSTIKKIASWDVETKGLGGPLLGASYCVLENGKIIESGFFRENIFEKLWERMTTYNDYTWNAHNANYDWRYLLPWLAEHGLDIDFTLATPSKILRVECEGVTMLDSYALYPQKLAKFSKAFAPGHSKLEIDDITNFDPFKPEHVEYAIRDAESLCIALYNYRKTFREIWGIEAGSTAAASALKAWRSTINHDVFPNPYSAWMRGGYYGGYVAPLITRPIAGAKTYDINSSYPDAMRTHGIPAGKFYQAGPKSYHAKRPGIWTVKVTTPNNLLVPVLPKRLGMEYTPPGHEAMEFCKGACVWPSGQFITRVTTPEIEFAKSVGYKIEIINGVYWEKLIFPFSDFVTRCEQLRAEYRGTPTEIVIKLTQNSLYGKFGTKRLRRKVELIPEGEELGFTPLEVLPDYGFKDEFDDSVLCAPELAAWITANARLNLLRTIYAGGAEHVIYCDTDSLTVTKDFDANKISVGLKYGQFKLEKEWEIFRAIAPKVYGGKKSTGKWEGACKGIPNPSEQDFIDIVNGAIVEKEYLSLSSSVAYFNGKSECEAKTQKRRSTDVAKVAGWRISLGNRTKPIFFKE